MTYSETLHKQIGLLNAAGAEIVERIRTENKKPDPNYIVPDYKPADFTVSVANLIALSTEVERLARLAREDEP